MFSKVIFRRNIYFPLEGILQKKLKFQNVKQRHRSVKIHQQVNVAVCGLLSTHPRPEHPNSRNTEPLVQFRFQGGERIFDVGEGHGSYLSAMVLTTPKISVRSSVKYLLAYLQIAAKFEPFPHFPSTFT